MQVLAAGGSKPSRRAENHVHSAGPNHGSQILFWNADGQIDEAVVVEIACRHGSAERFAGRSTVGNAVDVLVPELLSRVFNSAIVPVIDLDSAGALNRSNIFACHS